LFVRPLELLEFASAQTNYYKNGLIEIRLTGGVKNILFAQDNVSKARFTLDPNYIMGTKFTLKMTRLENSSLLQ
jgi:hypothetical protein